MNRITIILSAVIFLAISSGPAYALHSHFSPTGLIYYDKAKAFPGYSLVRIQWGPDQSGAPNEGFLLDIEGNVIRTWKNVTSPRFVNNGNLFAHVTGEAKPTMAELDWDGKTVWKWSVPDDRPDMVALHHQARGRVFNKKLNDYTYMSIMSRTLKVADGVAGGADPAKMQSDAQPDGIVEVDKNGKIIWEWWSFDHVIQDFDPTKANYVGKGKTIADYPGRYDINWGRGMRGDFVHFNSMDYNETLGQVVANNSTGSEFWVIDHQGTFVPGDYKASKALAAGSAGDLIYRWGNPSLYGAGKPASVVYGVQSDGDTQTFFTHGINWIEEGLPGAGHFLYFDNGQRRMGTTFSRILEINPYDGPMKNGVYIPEMKAGFDARHISNQVAWSYQGKHYESFYSHNGSCANRLPNGNTYVATGRGQLFQVTPQGEVVWEYILPVDDQGKITDRLFDQPAVNPSFPVMYGADHPALKGKDLNVKGTITELYKAGKLIIPEFKPQTGGKAKGE